MLRQLLKNDGKRGQIGAKGTSSKKIVRGGCCVESDKEVVAAKYQHAVGGSLSA
ncbi:MAG: hypothetical protein JWQ87_4783 [Candidatus Sulfotelmatobacter sp.]|nr:hypothetical protein [Candidatus Sulfotelmatobacter sp.]